jgi:DNA-binding NtrC family response regulator
MPGSIRILIVDDELSVRDSLRRWFEEEGCSVDVADSGKDALRKLAESTWDVFLLDIRMPGMDGLELQERIIAAQPDATIIIMTAYASVDSAVRAMKQGAHDYITKPFDPDAVERLVRTAVERRRLQKENVQLKRAVDELEPAAEIVGESTAIRDLRKLIEQVATADSAVRIVGEPGTGKEAVARAIHGKGKRRYMPFVVFGGGMPADAEQELELLGSERGTGAQGRRRGKLELADGGTLYLSELTELGPKAQEALLRAGEQQELVRIGGTTRVPADFRTIASSSADVEAVMAAGKLRRDLVDRLSLFVLRVPPLRERPEDVPVLAEHFLKRIGKKMNVAFTGFSPSALTLLRGYVWPGNVRELENAVERAAVVRGGGMIDAADLPYGGRDAGGDEKERVRRALEATGWNLAEAARVLGLDRVELFEKVKALGLEKGRPAGG